MFVLRWFLGFAWRPVDCQGIVWFSHSACSTRRLHQHQQYLLLLLSLTVCPTAQVTWACAHVTVPGHVPQSPQVHAVVQRSVWGQNCARRNQLLRSPTGKMFKDCTHASELLLVQVGVGKHPSQKSLRTLGLNGSMFPKILLINCWPLGSCSGYSYVIFSSDGRLDYSPSSEHQINDTVSSSHLHSDFVLKMLNCVLLQMESA